MPFAYVNKGSVTDAKGTTSLTWLEIVRQPQDIEAGRWRIVPALTRVALQP